MGLKHYYFFICFFFFCFILFLRILLPIITLIFNSKLRRRQLQVDGDSVVRVTHYLEEAFGKFKLNNMVVNITYKYEPPNHLTFLFSHFDKSLRLIDNSMSNHIIQWLHRETCQRLIYSMTKQNNKLTDDSNQRGNNSNFTWLNPSTTDSIIP